METVFEQAATVLSGDTNLFQAGTFAAPSASPGAVRAFVRAVDLEFSLAGQPARNVGWKASLPLADVPTRPVALSTLVVGTRTYTVRSAELESAGLYWTCDVDLVP